MARDLSTYRRREPLGEARERGSSRTLEWALGGAAAGGLLGWFGSGVGLLGALLSTEERVGIAAGGAVLIGATTGGAAYASHQGVNPWLVTGAGAGLYGTLDLFTVTSNNLPNPVTHVAVASGLGGALAALPAFTNRP